MPANNLALSCTTTAIHRSQSTNVILFSNEIKSSCSSWCCPKVPYFYSSLCCSNLKFLFFNELEECCESWSAAGRRHGRQEVNILLQLQRVRLLHLLHRSMLRQPLLRCLIRHPAVPSFTTGYTTIHPTRGAALPSYIPAGPQLFPVALQLGTHLLQVGKALPGNFCILCAYSTHGF